MFDAFPSGSPSAADEPNGFGGSGSASVRGGGRGDFFAPLSQEDSQRYAQDFEQCRGVDGFVLADAGRQRLEQTGLQNDTLQSIWHLSDLDRDGRLSLREFVCALYLAEQACAGRPVPVEVTVDQQITFVRSVERLVAPIGASPGGFPEAAKPGDAFSTADTVASLGPTSHARGNFDTADFSAWGSRPGGVGAGTPAGRGSTRGGGLAGIADGGESEASLGVGSKTLGQLASVFEVVARLDDGGETKRLSKAVLDERRELEKQLSRRRGYERDLQEARGALDNMREERRRVEMETSATQRRISHLQDELAFVETEVRSAEESLNMLRDVGNGSDSPSFGRRGPAPYNSPEEERRDVLSKVRAERELLQRDQRSIEDIRAKLDDIFRQKVDAQALQQALLEKQRQTEQDRGLMLTAIEAERGKLSAMRAERLRLWEERSSIEKELSDVAQQEWLATSGPPPTAVASRPSAMAAGTMAAPHAEAFSTAPAGSVALRDQLRKGVPNEVQPSVIYGSVPSSFQEAQPAKPMRSDGRGIRNTQ